MQDGLGREIDYLRISVTDKCNLRCRYCMPPQGITPLAHEEILTLEEIFRLVGIMEQLGIRKVRLTGGEPMVRKNLPWLVEQIHGLRGNPGDRHDYKWDAVRTAGRGVPQSGTYGSEHQPGHVGSGTFSLHHRL